MNKLLYIDESCHLENDNHSVMCIGYIKIDQEDYCLYKEDIKELKRKHHSPKEIKWNTVSNSRLPLYKELIDYFFSKKIQFRAILVKNKSQLNHERYNKGDHNSFYYKLIFFLLRNHFINVDNDVHKVFLDVKDTHGKEMVTNLEKSLKRHYKEWKMDSPFNAFQHIHSNESEFLQLTDLFIGAITYKSRNEHKKKKASKVKKEIISYIEKKSGYHLDDGTAPYEEKFNIFDFRLQTNINK